MKPWYELKQEPTKTDEEKIIVVCVEAIHESKTMETESEEKTYNVLCARVGASIDGEGKEDDGSVADESDPDPKEDSVE